MTSPTKITFGEMRASGVRDVLIYCGDHRCSHHTEANADGWADAVRLSPPRCRFAAEARLGTNASGAACDCRAMFRADPWPHGSRLNLTPESGGRAPPEGWFDAC